MGQKTASIKKLILCGLRIQVQTTFCQHMLRYFELGMPEVGAQQLQELHGLAGQVAPVEAGQGQRPQDL